MMTELALSGGETGLDYFGARYFSSAQGRFTSPDEFTGGIVDPFTGQHVGQPGPLPYADITDPQTLNKYAYVRNNPLRYIDPDGHDAVWAVDKDAGKTTVVIPVEISGEGATPNIIMAIVNRVNTLDTGGSGVGIQVIPTNKPVNGVLNRMNFSPGYDNKMCRSAGECVNEPGGNKAHINSANGQSTDAAAHDILHFAGIRGQYTEGARDANGNRTSTPKPGYDNSNIMTSRSGTKIKPVQIQEAKRNKSTRHCTVENGKTKCK